MGKGTERKKEEGEYIEPTQDQSYQRLLYESKTFLRTTDVYHSSIDPNLSNHKADRHLYAIRRFNAPSLDDHDAKSTRSEPPFARLLSRGSNT